MTNPIIMARAKANYEAECARVEGLFPCRHHPSWDQLVKMAETLDGVLQCVLHWYEAARCEDALQEDKP